MDGKSRPRGGLRCGLFVLAVLTSVVVPSFARAASAPFLGAVNVVPAAAPSVGGCIPFANNTDFGFTGFIYRNVPAFELTAGTKIAFDLAGTNDVEIRRDIYLSAASHNPAPGRGNVFALDWKKVVSTAQVPSVPRGNTIVGDYELGYRAEAPFSFAGGGLIIGFGAGTNGAADRGCEPVGVTTTINDPSGMFFARFWNKPHLDGGILDRVSTSTTLIPGFVVFADVTPPVVTATVDPPPGADGWVRSPPATVAWHGTDDASGVESCSPPVTLDASGVYELDGSCTDGAGNVGSATVTVRVGRSVDVAVVAGNRGAPLSPRRRGPATLVVRSTDGLDVGTIDVKSIRFGVRGTEDSIERCGRPRSATLTCRFDVGRSGVAPLMVFTAAADGIKVHGIATVRVVGQPIVHAGRGKGSVRSSAYTP